MSMPLKRILESLKNMQIETITNENGTAIKYPDGTMICYRKVLTGGWSGGSPDTNYILVELPTSFIDTEYKVVLTNNYNNQEWHLIPSTTVVTGTLSSGSATISYPTGMNKDNCIPISVNFGNASETQWACGALFDSSSYVGGAIPYKLLMREDNISLTLKNINLTNGDAPYVNNANVNLPYRVVLMKI